MRSSSWPMARALPPMNCARTLARTWRTSRCPLRSTSSRNCPRPRRGRFRSTCCGRARQAYRRSDSALRAKRGSLDLRAGADERSFDFGQESGEHYPGVAKDHWRPIADGHERPLSSTESLARLPSARRTVLSRRRIVCDPALGHQMTSDLLDSDLFKFLIVVFPLAIVGSRISSLFYRKTLSRLKDKYGGTVRNRWTDYPQFVLPQPDGEVVVTSTTAGGSRTSETTATSYFRLQTDCQFDVESNDTPHRSITRAEQQWSLD